MLLLQLRLENLFKIYFACKIYSISLPVPESPVGHCLSGHCLKLAIPVILGLSWGKKN